MTVVHPRSVREHAIERILDEMTIRTQAELTAALAARGVATTQATVSRDIRRLGVFKRPEEDGARYCMPAPGTPSPNSRHILESALRDFARDIGTGDALLIIRTLTGRANAVAAAVDEARLDGVVGTLAGDDSILVVCANAKARSRLANEIRNIAGV